MNARKFTNTLQADAEGFYAYWMENHNQDPIIWPLDMPEEEWFEQFMMYLQGADQE
jgi:hypothetical protein